jgi:hypothetical protein
MLDPQVYGLLGAVMLLHLGVLVYAYLRRNPAETAGPETAAEIPLDPSLADADIDPGSEGAVVCPECGTRNATGYEFCRHCVASLPGGLGDNGSDTFSSTA